MAIFCSNNSPVNLLLISCFFHFLIRVHVKAQVPAMFVFGDSQVDDGNNNFLSSFAKANYLPYGIDFSQGPSGRFTNGRTAVDVLGGLLGLPYVPAFADPTTIGARLLNGVNYASAAGGILEESGRQLGARYSLSQQVLNFQRTLTNLGSLMSDGSVSQYLAKSIAILVFGSNDYINNYLMPPLYNTSYLYNPQQFADLLISRYALQILALRSLGLRKFVIAGVGPIGCMPFQLVMRQTPPGRCADNVNKMVGPFNEGLKTLVDQLNAKNPDSRFVYANAYGIIGDMLNNPSSYGFSVTDRACCGLSVMPQITCLPLEVPCSNRRQFFFWDAFHPTEEAYIVLAQRTYNGPPNDCYPINIRQLTLI